MQRHHTVGVLSSWYRKCHTVSDQSTWQEAIAWVSSHLIWSPLHNVYPCNMDSHQKVCYLYWCFDCKQKRFTKRYQEIEREIFSTEFCWDSANDLVLGSYVVSSSMKKKKNMIILATYRSFLSAATDDGKDRVMLCKLYNFTKGETNIVDQWMGFYTSKVKLRKWPMVAFEYILDIALMNVSTLFALNNKRDLWKQDSFVFGVSVVFVLVAPFIQQRNQWRISLCVKAKIALILGTKCTKCHKPKCDAPFLSLSDKKKRCKFCVERMELGEIQKSIAPQKSLC